LKVYQKTNRIVNFTNMRFITLLLKALDNLNINYKLYMVLALSG